MGLSLLPRNKNKTLIFLEQKSFRSRIRTFEIIPLTPLVRGSFFRDAVESLRRTSLLVFKAAKVEKFRSRTKGNLGSTWEAKSPSNSSNFVSNQLSSPFIDDSGLMQSDPRARSFFEWLMSMPSLEARRLCIKINNIWIKLLKSPTPGITRSKKG